MDEQELEERVARAIYDSTVEHARSQSAHVVDFADLSPHWRNVHMRSARAAIRAINGEEALF